MIKMEITTCPHCGEEFDYDELNTDDIYTSRREYDTNLAVGCKCPECGGEIVF